MTGGADPWSLPGARQFLTEVEPMIWQGGAVITCDASTPDGLAARLVALLRDTVQVAQVVAAPNALPLAVLGEACGLPGAPMPQIVGAGCCFLIEAQGLDTQDLGRWGHALTDFAARFARVDAGGALLFIGNAEGSGLRRLDWRGRLRRVDAMIWAEHAVPSGRSELMQRLAVDLAVELCGWRLDLVADLVSQRQEDILDPMGWMERNADLALCASVSFGQVPFSCPLHLLASGGLIELRRRIWAAQLRVLFPWIESQRQRLIERYRKHLYISDHLRNLGVGAVEDIELGGLRHQLARVLPRGEADQVAALANLRNDLAHRKPILPGDFLLASQGAPDL